MNYLEGEYKDGYVAALVVLKILTENSSAVHNTETLPEMKGGETHE